MDTTVYDVDTTNRQIVDLTQPVSAFCTGRRNGLLNVYVPHATAGLAVIEMGAGSEPDLLELLDRLLPRDDRDTHRHGATGHGADHVVPHWSARRSSCRWATGNPCSARGSTSCSST